MAILIGGISFITSLVIAILVVYLTFRIFAKLSRSMKLEDFDEVYNRKALVAALAYEDGAVEYDYAVKMIFG